MQHFFLNCELLVLLNNLRENCKHSSSPLQFLRKTSRAPACHIMRRMFSFLYEDDTNGHTPPLLLQIIHIKEENHGILKRENYITGNIIKAQQVQQMGHPCFPKRDSNLY